jgi:hypothetical protein
MAVFRQPKRVWPRGDVWFLLVLIVLAVLVALLWFGDPGHSSDDNSRVSWPEAKPHKP